MQKHPEKGVLFVDLPMHLYRITHSKLESYGIDELRSAVIIVPHLPRVTVLIAVHFLALRVILGNRADDIIQPPPSWLVP